MNLGIRNTHLILSYNKGYRVSLCGRFMEYNGINREQKTINPEGYPMYSARCNERRI